MADTQDVANTIINIQLNKSAAYQTQSGIQDISNQLSGLTDDAKTAQQSFDDFADSLDKALKQGAQAGSNLGGSRRALGALGGIANRLSPGAGQAFGIAGDVTELTKDFPKLKEAIGGLSPTVLAGGVALAGLSLALVALKNSADATKQATLNDIDARNKALSLIQTGTTEQIQARIKELQTEKDLRQKAADDANHILEQGRQDITNQFGVIGRGIAEFDSALGTGAGELTAAKQNADSANKALNQTSTELDLLNQYATSGAKTQQDLAAAEKAAAEQASKYADMLYGFQQDSITNEVDTQKQIAELRKSGTEQQLNDALAAKQAEIDATKQQIAAEYALAAQHNTNSKDDERIYTEISEKISQLQAHQTDLAKSYDELNDATLRGYTISNDAAAKAAQTQQALVSAYEKYTDDVKSLESKFEQDSAANEQKRIDKLTQIQDQAVQDAEKLLADLQTKESDLARNLQRDLADEAQQEQQKQLQDQINFQRQEVQAEKKYQDDIARIKQQAKDSEFEEALNRDFAGLARTRRQTAQQISDVTRQAQEDRQARLQAFQQQQQDEQNQFNNERAQKIAKYQQDLQDAQLQYNRDRQMAAANYARERAQAQADYDQQARQLRDNLGKEITAKYNAAKAEITLAQQTSTVRIKTFQAEYNAAVQLFNAFANATTQGNSNQLHSRAFGGSLSVGMASLVNEANSSGHESYRTGGKSYNLPGAGIFIPSKSGTVEPNRGGDTITVSAPITINGAGQSPEKIAALVDQKLETTIRRIFVNKAS